VCQELGVTPLDDPMNQDDRFQRVRIRNEVMPLLGDVSKRDVVDVLVRQSQLLRDDDQFLDELAAMIDVQDAKAIAKAPIALARRAIRQWLADPLPPNAATIERVLAVARGEATACDIGDGRQVRRSQQRLGIRLSDVM
jgi:tRNA(Ile)-lysidine synthase